MGITQFSAEMRWEQKPAIGVDGPRASEYARPARMPARNVAMPNNRPPRIYTEAARSHIVGRTPRSNLPAGPLNIPIKACTNAPAT